MGFLKCRRFFVTIILIQVVVRDCIAEGEVGVDSLHITRMVSTMDSLGPVDIPHIPKDSSISSSGDGIHIQPATGQARRREAKILFGELDRQSCFAQMICGLGTKPPTQKTSLVNDYAYLVGELFLDSKEVNPANKVTENKTPNKIQNDETSQAEEEDEEEGFKDWLSVADYRMQKMQMNKMPPPPPKRQQPRPHPPRIIPIRHSTVPLFRIGIRRRMGRQIAAATSRNCGRGARALVRNCPYNETEMAGVVTNLKKLLEGDTDAAFTTVAMNTLGNPGANVNKQETRKRPQPSRTNVVMNLHQNLAPPQSSGFAAVPFSIAPLALQTIFSQKNGSELRVDSDSKTPSFSSGGFQPFYILPLPTAPAAPTSTETPTTTLEPYENLLHFLYSVDHIKNATDTPKNYTSIAIPPTTSTVKPNTNSTKLGVGLLNALGVDDYEESEEEEADEDEQDEGGSNEDSEEHDDENDDEDDIDEKEASESEETPKKKFDVPPKSSKKSSKNRPPKPPPPPPKSHFRKNVQNITKSQQITSPPKPYFPKKSQSLKIKSPKPSIMYATKSKSGIRPTIETKLAVYKLLPKTKAPVRVHQLKSTLVKKTPPVRVHYLKFAQFVKKPTIKSQQNKKPTIIKSEGPQQRKQEAKMEKKPRGREDKSKKHKSEEVIRIATGRTGRFEPMIPRATPPPYMQQSNFNMAMSKIFTSVFRPGNTPVLMALQ